MILTNDNYYSRKANCEFMSVSQYKDFLSCEAMAMAKLRGEWQEPKSTALLVGSYIDSYFEGTLSDFKLHNPEIYKKGGKLKADYIAADWLIKRIKKDKLFMEYMSGQKQIIKTGELFGCKWKIKIDSYFPYQKIVDLKIMRSLDRIMGKSFVEYWGYDLQMAVYSAIEGHNLETYLAVATKETVPNLEIINIPGWRRAEVLADVKRMIPRILAVKSGREKPERCEMCDYCKSTKILTEPIDYEFVGLSAAERKAIFGTL